MYKHFTCVFEATQCYMEIQQNVLICFAGRTGKVQKRKTNKDPNKPKRPTSAYFYYVARQRQELEKQGKKVTKVSFTKTVTVLP